MMNSAEKEAVLHCLKSIIDEEVCEECPLYDTTGTDHCGKDCVRLAINALSSSEKPNKWIPVSERLPKGSDIVLLSLPPHIDPNGEECSASVICGHYIGGKDKEWGLSDGDTCGYGIVSIRKGTNPIAWMPLPEPYEPQESEVEE